ncbi:MAG TPA: M48 family metallopeptidase [bacterium]|jgi:hypothetical protein|nr:M48 family metallopeptidase [bacterium]HOG38319.1 M48 family metallopeptidase [bacterium]HQI03282.1 M48 family metallopeptidase [bacterium]
MIKINKIIYSKRKTLCIEINKYGEIIARSPKNLSIDDIQKFVNEKSNWIYKQLHHRKNCILKAQQFLSKNKTNISKSVAYKTISNKVSQLSSTFGFKYNIIKITEAKTRWASCSNTNNLSFTKKVALLPDDILKYIIIHELAHTKEKNHGKNFWKIVQQIIPNYKTKIKWLKEHKYILISDL